MDRRFDDTPTKAWVRALERIKPLSKNDGLSLPTLLDDLSVEFADNPALIGIDDAATYRELARRCNQYARWALQQDIRPGDAVCLLMRNCVDYPAIWLGISRVGGVVALINTNLTEDALVHAIVVAAPAHLIAGAELAASVDAVRDRLPDACACWIAKGERPGWRTLDRTRFGGGPMGDAARRPSSNREPALLVYTSGTTGMPKAARISHYRVLEWSFWFAGMIGAGPRDRLFDCLPLYHSTGGVVGVGALLVSGGSVVIRERFSASRFWDDVADQRCTLFLYIGELCRYLLGAPPHARERDHRLRLCLGNGLRGDVWEAFERRFGIPGILEFYASTEGNVSLYNCDGRPGAIGRVPAFLTHSFPVALIACDEESGLPHRGADGMCVRCAPGEPGEAVGRIAEGTGAFEGYTDPVATERKILRDVFREGDAWFRTGDLMRRDAAGFFYFVDRIGDTFRWKGENVSATQVADALCACRGVKEAAVYGVEVPGAEGRAGMAAITTAPEFSLSELHAHLRQRLPDYARPLFLRVCDALDVTGTFKPVKARLQREGIDPEAAREPLYLNDSVAFVTLDAQLHERIRQGRLRL